MALGFHSYSVTSQHDTLLQLTIYQRAETETNAVDQKPLAPTGSHHILSCYDVVAIASSCALIAALSILTFTQTTRPMKYLQGHCHLGIIDEGQGLPSVFPTSGPWGYLGFGFAILGPVAPVRGWRVILTCWMSRQG